MKEHVKHVPAARMDCMFTDFDTTVNDSPANENELYELLIEGRCPTRPRCVTVNRKLNCLAPVGSLQSPETRLRRARLDNK